MSKGTTNKPVASDLSRLCKSTFTLTFAVEIVGIDVWHDCELGWLDLGSYMQGLKIQYQLYPGQTYDLDILIWPYAAKIWCGSQYGWVRTWQFLERRWLTFSIRHAFPVRVMEFQNHLATVTPMMGTASLGANAKNDKNFEIFLPPLSFGERRYFASVLEAEESLVKFLLDLIWSAVVKYIPASVLDGEFDIPQVVSDVRNQDAILDYVRDALLERTEPDEPEAPPDDEDMKSKDRPESKMPKEKEKKKVPEAAKVKPKFEIKLLGDIILSGTGRIVSFETVGDRPADLGEIIVLISSNNLPAQDDYPVVFLNVGNLCEIPLQELKKLRITQLYTRWKIGEEVHDSETQLLKSRNDISFNDHHAVPVPYEMLSKIMADFYDDCYEIQLRGIRLPSPSATHALFGYQKSDRDFDSTTPKLSNTDLDILIAVTKIHGRKLAKGLNSFIQGEYPLYPPIPSVKTLEREAVCTNDINAIRVPVEPDLIVKSYVILLAQMTLQVSIGLVGCKPQAMCRCFSRMFCLIRDSEAVMSILRYIVNMNEDIATRNRDDMLTGFALDTGDLVVLYVEGPKDGYILQVWDMTEDFYPIVKPLFSCSTRYSSRIYPDMLTAALPFTILKMYVSLGVFLACPPVYARPALPLPTRSAVLKLGRLVASKFRFPPPPCDMPTSAELKSLRLELCVAPCPTSLFATEHLMSKNENNVKEKQKPNMQTTSKINWDN